MNRIAHNFKNTLWLFGSQIFSHIGKLFLFLIVAREIGVSEFGLFSFGLSFYVIFSFLADLGIPAVLRRKYSVLQNKRDHFAYAISLKLKVSAISSLVVFIVTFFVSKDPTTHQLIWTLWLAGVCNLFIETFFSYFEAENNLKIRGIVKISRSLFILGLGIWITFLKGTALSISVAFLIEALLSLFFVIFIFIKKNKNLIIKTSKQIHQNILKQSWYSAMMTLFWNIYVSFDLFMLGLYNQIQATGLYGASQKLFNAVIAPAIILPNIYIPIFTKAFKEKKSIKKTLVSLTITSLGCAIALAIAGIFFPKFIMQLIYGQEYISASFSLTILCITAAIYYINNIFFSLAFALYQDKKILFTNIFMATLNIVLNIFVIPVYSFNGAAVTTLISTIFLLIGNAYICYIAFKNKNNLLYSNQEKENE